MSDRNSNRTHQPAVVADLMASGPITIHVTDNAGRARDLLAAMGFHALPVVEGNRIVGIITTTDLADNWPDEAPVRQMMSRAPHSIHREATLEAAAANMLANEIHHLVIEDSDGQGILSSFDLLRAFVQRPHPD